MIAVARSWDPHSKLVFWLKILLPISAILILSTLFLASHSVRPEDAIPYADVDIRTLVREPHLTAPVFTGMTADGAALSLMASEARVGNADNLTSGQIVNLVGLLETPDGGKTNLSANLANMDQTGGEAVLTGDVVVSNSIGYQINSQSIRLALDQTSIESPGAITADGPVGKLTAGSMHLGLAGGDGSGYVLLFKGGVTLLYLPSSQGTEN